MEVNKIYNSDSLAGLKTMPDNSVDCCVTSPPYYLLRDYGVDGQIGLEDTPEQYINKLLEVFMEVYRVLKPSGTLWMNIGDTYAGSGRGWGGKNDLYSRKIQPIASYATEFSKPKKLQNYKNKDLIGIPWMLAFALRSAGWYLRNDIIWHKPDCMPESVTDRCTKSHEHIFLFTKSPKYYFDSKAIAEPAVYTAHKKPLKKYIDAKYRNNMSVDTLHKKGFQIHAKNDFGAFIRNKRDVWIVSNGSGEKEAHFASFPQKLIVDCIKAGCTEGGLVLDPFMGSGTTAVVAKMLERDYIGFELNKDYLKIAERKLRKNIGLFTNTG